MYTIQDVLLLFIFFLSFICLHIVRALLRILPVATQNEINPFDAKFEIIQFNFCPSIVIIILPSMFPSTKINWNIIHFEFILIQWASIGKSKCDNQISVMLQQTKMAKTICFSFFLFSFRYWFELASTTNILFAYCFQSCCVVSWRRTLFMKSN